MGHPLRCRALGATNSTKGATPSRVVREGYHTDNTIRTIGCYIIPAYFV